MVLGDDGPAVFLGAVLDFLFASIDHGLDGEGHALFKLVQRAGAPVVQHLRFFVKNLANAVAAKLAHHAEAMAFGKLLDRKTNITQVDAGLDQHDAFPHGLIGDVGQPLGGNGYLAHHEHAAGVAVPAVLDNSDVNIDHVAFFEGLVVGYAMADLVVDRGANGFWVGRLATALVVQRGRDGTLHLGDVVIGQFVQRVGGDAGLDEGCEVIKHLRGEAARNTHARDALGVFVGNGHGVIIPEPTGACSLSTMKRPTTLFATA